METVFCVECGARNNGKSRFCAKCGSMLASESRWGEPVIVSEVKVPEKHTNRREVSKNREGEVVAKSLNQNQEKAPMLALLFAGVGLYLNFIQIWNLVLNCIVGSGYMTTDNIWMLISLVAYVLIVIGVCMYRKEKTFFCGIGFVLLGLLAAIDVFAYGSLNIRTLLSVLKINVFILCGLGYFLKGKARTVFTRIGGILLIVVSVITIFSLIAKYQHLLYTIPSFFSINYLQPIMLGVAVLLYCPKKKL